MTREHLAGFAVVDDIWGQLLKISEKLQYLYKGKLSLETVERYVFESYELLDAKSDVKVYLLPLAERFSRDRSYENRGPIFVWHSRCSLCMCPQLWSLSDGCRIYGEAGWRSSCR